MKLNDFALQREQLVLINLIASTLTNCQVVNLLLEHDSIDEYLAILRDTYSKHFKTASMYIAIEILRELRLNGLLLYYVPYNPKKYAITSRALRPIIRQGTLLLIDTKTKKANLLADIIFNNFKGKMFRIPITKDIIKYKVISTTTLGIKPIITEINSRKDLRD